MKTLLIQTQRGFKAIGLIGVVLLAFMAFNPVQAQSTSAQRTIKGVVSDDAGPLPGVNIVLKGTKTGTITDDKGAFTFPQSLATGDVLVFSYLGYEKQEVTIKSDSDFINLTLSQDLIEIMGAVATDKPYKTKRKNRK